MAYTLDNLRTDIRNYTEVGSNVLSDTVLERIIKNAELKIHRAIDTDQLRSFFEEHGVKAFRAKQVDAGTRPCLEGHEGMGHTDAVVSFSRIHRRKSPLVRDIQTLNKSRIYVFSII